MEVSGNITHQSWNDAGVTGTVKWIYHEPTLPHRGHILCLTFHNILNTSYTVLGYDFGILQPQHNNLCSENLNLKQTQYINLWPKLIKK